MWLRVKWLQTGAWLYGVHKTCADTATVSLCINHVTTKQTVSTPIWWIFRMHYSRSLIWNHIRQEHSESAGEQRMVLYESDHGWFQGQIFSGKDHRVYLLGNPILFWAAVILKVIFFICYIVHSVKRKRRVKMHPALLGENHRLE